MFKVGDRVVPNLEDEDWKNSWKDSEYQGGKDAKGTISLVRSGDECRYSDLNYTVKWDNGKSNAYGDRHLLPESKWIPKFKVGDKVVVNKNYDSHDKQYGQGTEHTVAHVPETKGEWYKMTLSSDGRTFVFLESQLDLVKPGYVFKFKPGDVLESKTNSLRSVKILSCYQADDLKNWRLVPAYEVEWLAGADGRSSPNTYNAEHDIESGWKLKDKGCGYAFKFKPGDILCLGSSRIEVLSCNQVGDKANKKGLPDYTVKWLTGTIVTDNYYAESDIERGWKLKEEKAMSFKPKFAVGDEVQVADTYPSDDEKYGVGTLHTIKTVPSSPNHNYETEDGYVFPEIHLQVPSAKVGVGLTRADVLKIIEEQGLVKKDDIEDLISDDLDGRGIVTDEDLDEAGFIKKDDMDEVLRDADFATELYVDGKISDLDIPEEYDDSSTVDAVREVQQEVRDMANSLDNLRAEVHSSRERKEEVKSKLKKVWNGISWTATNAFTMTKIACMATVVAGAIPYTRPFVFDFAKWAATFLLVSGN